MKRDWSILDPNCSSTMAPFFDLICLPHVKFPTSLQIFRYFKASFNTGNLSTSVFYILTDSPRCVCWVNKVASVFLFFVTVYFLSILMLLVNLLHHSMDFLVCTLLYSLITVLSFHFQRPPLKLVAETRVTYT